MDRQALHKQLIKHEGLKLKMYTDTVGIPTIGVGHNLRNPISEKAALQILEDDIDSVIKDLNYNLPWWSTLSEVRQRVLIDMCFNLGIVKLLGFVHTLEAIKHGEYAKASSLMLQSKWATQVGTRATRLACMLQEDKE